MESGRFGHWRIVSRVLLRNAAVSSQIAIFNIGAAPSFASMWDYSIPIYHKPEALPIAEDAIRSVYYAIHSEEIRKKYFVV